jgi:uncharacterized protein (TIGR02444 family)
MTTLQLSDTPLWDFSLAVYGGDGVENECLALQERLQLDVNLLLFVAFAGAVEGMRLEMQDIAAANTVVAGWHRDIVRSLRHARRALKPASNDTGSPLCEASSTLRSQVKISELQAERIEQEMLWRWSRHELAGRPVRGRDQALAANLRGVLEFYGVAANDADAAAAVPHLLETAASYVPSPP